MAVVGLLGALPLVVLAAAPASAVPSPRAKEWHINAMGLPTIWKTTTGKGITVAVVDGGVDGTRPDLAGRVLPGHDFSPGAKNDTIADQFSHGTAMASLIAGTGKGLGGQGALGMAPGAKILPLRVIYNDLASSDSVSQKDFEELMAKAIRYAADSPAQIINVSQGAFGKNADLDAAVQYALSKNKLIFAAVGNERDSGNPVEYPAAIPGVVGIGSLDKKGAVASESETGSDVALAAPGVDMIEACVNASGYCLSHGTSDATAVASGAAALVWARHPSWTGNEVLRALIKTAKTSGKPGSRSDFIGYGLVRPYRAMRYTGDVGPADVNPLLPKVKPTPSSAAGSPGKASAAPSAGSTAAASATGGQSSGMLWTVGGAVVVVAAIGVFLLVRRRER